MTSRPVERCHIRVAVVGPCASGKTTLVEGLRELGFDAYVCGQEHSEISHLWRHGDPRVVILLDIDLAMVRSRRGAEWPEQLFFTQLRRLEGARAVARLVIDARCLSPEEVLANSVAVLDPVEPRSTNSPR